MTQQTQPAVTVTQPKVAFILSLVTLAGLIYAGSEKIIRTEFQIKELRSSYIALMQGQVELKSEVKSLRQTIDGEIRNMSIAINRLSDTLETQKEEVK